MKPYKFLPHTADAKFEAYGKTLEEAFMNAAYAMESIIIDTEKVIPDETVSIKAKGKDHKELLYDFLEQFLIVLDTEGFVIHGFTKTPKIKKTSDGYELEAEAIGDTLSSGSFDYEIKGEVKAVTYNDMEITEKNCTWKVIVVVDL